MNNFQDWKPVVLNATKKKAPPVSKTGDQKAFHKLDQSTEPKKVEFWWYSVPEGDYDFDQASVEAATDY